MLITYHLSNSQRKELLLRGQQIELALPVPPHRTPDPLAWARSVLPRDIAPLATAARVEALWVAAIRSPAPNLTGHLGRIVPDPIGTLCQRVQAVIVTLTPADHRGTREGLSWPLEVRFGDDLLPWRES